jgi:hypothetical protein
MKKRADDIEVGERLYEFGDVCSGIIISKMNDPEKPTRAYMLVRSDNGSFSIYGVCRDACAAPHLTRFIPAPVMKQFLFDAFVGQELEHVPGKTNVTRVPLVTEPKYAPPVRGRQPPSVSAPVLPAAPDRSDEPETTSMAEPPVAPGPAPDPEPEVDSRMLPEIDFPS